MFLKLRSLSILFAKQRGMDSCGHPKAAVTLRNNSRTTSCFSEPVKQHPVLLPPIISTCCLLPVCRIAAPYMGAYINPRDSRVHNFTVALDKGYNFTRPSRTFSCVTSLERQPLYVEAGGAYYDDAKETYGTNKGVFTMDVFGPGRPQHQLVRAAGGDVIPQRAQAALACGPDGQVRLRHPYHLAQDTVCEYCLPVPTFPVLQEF